MIFDHCQAEAEVPEYFRTLLDAIAADLQPVDYPAVPSATASAEELNQADDV